MSQLAASDGQPRLSGGGTRFFLRRLGTVRFQAEGWQEPCESRDSRTDLRGTGGEIPPVYPTTTYGGQPFLKIVGFEFDIAEKIWIRISCIYSNKAVILKGQKSL
jgi:hypothetical protein